MPPLMIRFDGLCCHITPPAGRLSGIGRRAVLPNLSAHSPRHICYVESYTNDYDPAANPMWSAELKGPYTRFNDGYVRVELSDVKIAIANRVVTPGLSVTTSFQQAIPQLRKVCPSFEEIRPALLQPVIRKDEVAAYFDITAGTLASGPTESFRTSFDPEFVWPKRHLGQWAQLELEIEDVTPILLVTDLKTGAARPLTFKAGTDLITIGNQTEDDILGKPPPPNTTGHFAAYYDLAVFVDVKPAPKGEGLGLGTGCTNSGWP